MAKPKPSLPALFHVGSLVQCDEAGCTLHSKPRTFTGSGDEWDAADRFAEIHERRNPHSCTITSLYSTEALKG